MGDAISSHMMVTFRLAADKVVPRRGRAMSSLNEVVSGQHQGRVECKAGGGNPLGPVFTVEGWV